MPSKTSANSPDMVHLREVDDSQFTGYVDSIEKSLKYGTISEFDVNTSNSSGETALFLSCVYGHEQILLKLLELEHLQISKPHDRTGSTPLHGR